jgi:hypothetical protein
MLNVRVCFCSRCSLKYGDKYFLVFLVRVKQHYDGEATEPVIKELEEDREESQDPEVEFAIAAAVRDYDGLEIILGMIQVCRRFLYCLKFTLKLYYLEMMKILLC